MKIACMSFIIFFFAFSHSANSTTYYVAKSGSNSNPGTEALPWLEIGKAANTVKAGDIVYVKQGTYREEVYVDKSGSAGNLITFQAYPGHTVIVGKSDYNYGFWVVGNYVKIQGFEVTETQGGGIGTTGHHNIISECTVHDIPKHGILCAYPTCHDNIIEHNTCYRGGLETGGMSGISIWQAGEANIIRNNVSYDNKQPDANWSDGNGIIIDWTDASGTEVYQNICYGNDGSGIAITESDNVKIFNNILYDNGKSELSKENRCGVNLFSENGRSNNIIIKNNIMMNNHRAELSAKNDAANLSHDINYNAYYRDSGKVIEWGRGTYGTLQEFKDYTPYGNNSIEQDPLFINVANRDFHIQINSPCVDAGTDTGLRYSGQAPDIGVFENKFSNKGPAPPANIRITKFLAN